MLEILASSSVLILVITLLRAALKDRISARLQYALWLPVLIRLLLPAGLYHSPYSVAQFTAPAVSQVQDYSSRLQVAELPEAILAPAQFQPDPASPGPSLTLETAARVIWFVGMAGMAVWFLLVNARLAGRLRKSRVPCPYPSALPVYITEDIPSPCLFGLFRPTIYLTERAASDDAQASRIIAHELTHYRHGDMIWALLRSLCLVIWWFDPLVWLAAALSRQDAELACDEGTIRALGEQERFDYGRTLVDLAKVGSRPSDLLCGATTMTSGRKPLRERVERIAKAPKTSLVLAALVLLTAALAVGCTYTGAVREPENGPVRDADVFRRYYSQAAASDTAHDYSRMDLDILDAMACGTAGAVVDTEELTIEAVGAIVSGNTAEIVLRVTAKQLDTVLRDGEGVNKDYCFGDESALLGIFTLNRSYCYLAHHYYYSDTNNALAPNQFELRYWIIVPEPFETEPYVIPYWVDEPASQETKPFILPLSDFGYYESGRFVPLYRGRSENEGDWNVALSLRPAADTGKRRSIDREITLGDRRFRIKDIQLTPLSCTIRLECLEDESVIEEDPGAIFNAFWVGLQTPALTLSDGSRLGDECFDLGGGNAMKDYYVRLSFFCPMAAEEIASVSLFGQEFSFD